MALIILILKSIVLPKRLIPKWLGVSDCKVNRFSVCGSEKIARKLIKLKSQKLSKSRNLKSKKLFKSQKLAKSKKNCQKVGMQSILKL